MKFSEVQTARFALIYLIFRSLSDQGNSLVVEKLGKILLRCKFYSLQLDVSLNIVRVSLFILPTLFIPYPSVWCRLYGLESELDNVPGN